MNEPQLQQDSAEVEASSEAAPVASLAPVAAKTKHHYNARINELARDARPSEVTEVGRRKLFENWEKAGKTIEQAEKMLADAKTWRVQAAEDIVRALGRGHFRYKEVLYSITAKTHKDGTTVFLRPMAKKAIDV